MKELAKGWRAFRRSGERDNHADSGEIFKSANDNPDRVNLVIPVTHFDISDHNFVEILFWPRALADQPVKSVKALFLNRKLP